MSVFNSIKFLDDNKEIVVAENGKLPELDGSLLKNLPPGTISVGNGLTGNGTEASPLKLNLKNFNIEHDSIINGQAHSIEVSEIGDIEIHTNGRLSVSCGDNYEISSSRDVVISSDTFIDIKGSVLLNLNAENTAGGFAVVQEDGKLPSSILPNIDDSINSSLGQIQVGGIILLACSSIPEGYLLCDGSELNRVVYSELFSVIGTTWGSGDGVNTFNLPDIVNKTVWGGTTDNIGNYKQAGLPNITGQLFQDGVDADTNNGLIWGGTGAFDIGEQQENNCAVYLPSNTSRRPKRMTFDASRLSNIYGNSNTVQPPAAVMQFCIKYM